MLNDLYSLSHNQPLVTIGIYLALVGLLAWWAHRLYHERWQRRERARTTLGVLLVLGPALFLAALGRLDLLTALVILAGFGVAGAVTLHQDIQADTEASMLIRETIWDAESR